jgi:excinuclease ABC subunit C
MVRRKYRQEEKERMLQSLMETLGFQTIVQRLEMTEGAVRNWARCVVKEYAMYNLAFDETHPSALQIDGVPVEQMLIEFQQRKKQQISAFGFVASCYPEEPGCYLMKDRAGEVIYVGKAKNLRNRLSSYFQRRIDLKKTELLVGEIADLEIIIVNNEAESLFLENNLIKLYRPKYNRLLMRDDTGYAYIVLTKEQYPRLAFYRKGRVNRELAGVAEDEREKRFGPFLNAQLLLQIASENYQLRTCRTLEKRVCLSYHLKRCSGVCEGLIAMDAYDRAVQKVVTFLSYRPEERIQEMRAQMLEYAEALDFEKAQKIKVQIRALENTLEKQIVERDVEVDQDVIYFGAEKVLVTEIMSGMIRNLQIFDLELDGGYEAACERFVVTRYGTAGPDELIVNQLSEPERLEKALSWTNGRKV